MTVEPKRLRLDQGAPLVALPQRGRMILGSDAERADVLLAGAGVEPVHCTIGRIKGGGFALQDLGTNAGTLVNGQRITTARLAVGDVLEIGTRRIEVEGDPEPEKPSPALAPTGKVKASAPKPPRIPGFQLEGLLGRGSSGVVWSAIQESLQRRVALKVLAPRLAADQDFVRRFQEEARAAARFAHPNVVHVYDVGQAGAVHYLAMEVMDGGCLESRLVSNGPVPWRVALDALADAARALVYAETLGLVHRDIKPANLMVATDGTTKLADLGLAAQVEQASLEQTVERKVLGTPHFIAPEVVRGATADSRSDLYSLGATAYRLLSGHTPFEGPRTADILRSVLNDTPAALAARVPGLPASVASCVHRLLAKDPADRHPTAQALLDELDALRSGSTAVGASSGPPKALLVVGGLIIAAVAVLFAFRGGGDTPDGPGSAGSTQIVRDESGSETENGSTPGTDPSIVDTGPNGIQSAVVGTGTDAKPTDDDAAEHEFELEATAALERLEAEELTDALRAERLRELAVAFPGTTAATTAGDEAVTLETALTAANVATSALDQQRAVILASLRAAGTPATDPPLFGQALTALRVVPGQDLWAKDPLFLTQRGALVTALLESAALFGATAIEESTAFESKGEFLSSSGRLQACINGLALPAFPGQIPARAAEVQEIRAQAVLLLEDLELRELNFGVAQVEGDRRAIATAFGGSQGLEAELRNGNFDAAHARLKQLMASLSTPGAKSRIQPVLQDVGLIRTAQNALIQAWTSPGWRRRSILDPRGRKPSTAECGGIDRTGVRIEGTLVPWSHFIARPRTLANLFHERVEGGWTTEVEVAISAWLRVTTVLDVIEQASEMLGANSVARFTTGEVKALNDAFQPLLGWVDDPATAAAALRERSAAKALGHALNAISEEHWSEASVRLDRVLHEHEGSLIVLLLSDGRDL
jgi:serine/threonine protein kinase